MHVAYSSDLVFRNAQKPHNCTEIHCERWFLSFMEFSVYKVVRARPLSVASLTNQLRNWSTSESNDFVNAKSRACERENSARNLVRRYQRSRKMIITDFYTILRGHTYEKDNKLNTRKTLELSLSHKVLNLNIFPRRNINSTQQNFVWSGSLLAAIMSTIITMRTWGIPLRIYSVVLHRSHAAHFPLKWCYSILR